MGCIYRHPSMALNDFTDNYLNQLLAKMAGNKNNIFFSGDFNIDLMKNDIDANTLTFLDLLTSHLFVPHIIHPTRITTNSKTVIDNIFSNSPNFSEGISGNITLSISDHLVQFLLIPMNLVDVTSKIYLYKRDTKNILQRKFLTWPPRYWLVLSNQTWKRRSKLFIQFIWKYTKLTYWQIYSLKKNYTERIKTTV